MITLTGDPAQGAIDGRRGARHGLTGSAPPSSTVLQPLLPRVRLRAPRLPDRGLSRRPPPRIRSLFVRSKESLTIEVDEVVGGIGDPNLRFPSDLGQVLAHRGPVEEGSHEERGPPLMRRRDRAPAGGDQGIERRRQDARDLRSREALRSALLLAAAGGCGHPCRGDRVRRHADEEAPFDDSLLGRAPKESREVARRLAATGTCRRRPAAADR